MIFLSILFVSSQGLAEIASEEKNVEPTYPGIASLKVIVAEVRPNNLIDDSLQPPTNEATVEKRFNPFAFPEDSYSPALRRFLEVYKRQTNSDSDSLPNLDSLTSSSKLKASINCDTPAQDKSGIGNVVNTVKKKWVKIVEIVVPIAVGIPLLIIALILCVCCGVGCKGRRERRRMERA